MPTGLLPLKLCPGNDSYIFSVTLSLNSIFVILKFLLFRQILTFVRIEAGPLEAAGKDVGSVVKTIDAKLAAVGIIAEKVKSQCKGCPTVSSI